MIGRKAVDRINVCLQRRFINGLKLLNQAAVLRKIDTIIFNGASGLMGDCIQFNPHVAGNEVVTEPFFKLFIKISGEQGGRCRGGEFLQRPVFIPGNRRFLSKHIGN